MSEVTKPVCFGDYRFLNPENQAVRECFTCTVADMCQHASGQYNKKMNGTKLDIGKPRWSLFPDGALDAVLAVLEHGAHKYSVGNWMDVHDNRTRYYDAAMRHINLWWTGELRDSESHLPHLAHAICCLMFLMWFDAQHES